MPFISFLTVMNRCDFSSNLTVDGRRLQKNARQKVMHSRRNSEVTNEKTGRSGGYWVVNYKKEVGSGKCEEEANIGRRQEKVEVNFRSQKGERGGYIYPLVKIAQSGIVSHQSYTYLVTAAFSICPTLLSLFIISIVVSSYNYLFELMRLIDSLSPLSASVFECHDC